MIVQIPSKKLDSNSYLVEEEGRVIIIDTGGDDLDAQIECRGWTPEYIFLTHEHFDHIKWLEQLRDRFDVPVVACELTSKRICSVKTNLSNIADILTYYKTGVIAEERSRSYTCREADIVFEDTYELSWRGHRFCFERLPGHSPGSVIITMDGEAVFSGDYLIWQEEELLRLKGGSPEDYEQYARPVLERIPDGMRIYPGHGRIYTKGQDGSEDEDGGTND